jgi:hypothetical protein
MALSGQDLAAFDCKIWCHRQALSHDSFHAWKISKQNFGVENVNGNGEIRSRAGHADAKPVEAMEISQNSRLDHRVGQGEVSRRGEQR